MMTDTEVAAAKARHIETDIENTIRLLGGHKCRVDGHKGGGGPSCNVCQARIGLGMILGNVSGLRAERDGLLAVCRAFLDDPIVAELDPDSVPSDPDEARGYALLRAMRSAVAKAGGAA